MGILIIHPKKKTQDIKMIANGKTGGGWFHEYTDDPDPHDTTTQFESKISSVSQEYLKTQKKSMIFSRKTIS